MLNPDRVPPGFERLPDKDAPERRARKSRVSPFGGEAATRPVQFKSAAEFFGEYEPLAYIVDGLIESGKLYTVTARTGGGKTAFLTALAIAIATGRADILGREIGKGRVLFCTFENPVDFRMRLIVACYFYGIELADLCGNLVIIDKKATPEAIASSADGEFALIMGDTYQAWFDGDDLNSNTQTGEFTRRARILTELRGKPAVLIAAHPRKNATSDELIPYGGGAIINEVDGNFALNSIAGGTQLHWQGKLRGLDFDPIAFRYEIATSPTVLDKKGRGIQLPVLRLSSAEFVEAREKAAIDRDAALLTEMAKNPGGTVRQWAADAGISSSAVDRRLKSLATKVKGNLAVQTLDKWTITPAGRKALEARQ